MTRKIKLIILSVIILLATFLRFYKLDQVPPSLNWDEVAAGYNAFTIWHWGADEYGNKFPITFKSFGDDKHPVHIYLTAPFVGIFGLSDYSARASSALVGVLGVIAIYFLAKILFKNKLVGIFASLFLAVSPYHLQFSRGLWETNFALFFFILGLTLFYFGIERKNWMLPASFASFGLSFFSYHSAKIVVPPVVLLLCILHFKSLFENKKLLIACAAVGIIFGGLVIRDPRILGFARINQTSFSQDQINKFGGVAGTYIHNYKQYFNYSYLFSKGDQGSRASVKVVGEFYKIDLVFLAFGVLAVLLKKRWETLALLILWLALSPIPGVVSSFDTSATRGEFMLGPIILLSGSGAAWIIETFRKRELQIIASLIILVFLGREVYYYLNYYYTEYSKAEAIEWQYGMEQVVDYVAQNPDYRKVYMDKIRQQPYIFFLFYLKTPLPELLKTVRYDESESKSYNTVASYDKYQFGGWDIIDSPPAYYNLYIVTPSYYGGLRYIEDFNVEKLIKYPDGKPAFYLVRGNQ